MKKINKFKFNKTINLYCFTDVHLGAKDHDSKKFKKAIDILKKDPNGYAFFNGDTLEFIPPNYGIPESGQVKSVDDQIEEYVNLLKSLKNKVLFFRVGNHEQRLWKLGGVDLAKQIGRETGIITLHDGMEEVQFQIGKKLIRFVSTHGEGGGSKKVLNNMILTFGGADVYFSGHTHEMFCNAGNLNVRTETGVEEFRPQLEIVGGSFLAWADYARSKNMRPTQTGCYILQLSENGASVKGQIV